jgi:hypothetical protein
MPALDVALYVSPEALTPELCQSRSETLLSVENWFLGKNGRNIAEGATDEALNIQVRQFISLLGERVDEIDQMLARVR